ncbi:Similar to engase: Cytosolic endo-beta-N-acetylglucosaminidase (Danio rerio) [Cotesia congregata]|uniref:Similar to engase: Cytosolic endo-beta-N-acetylglucosaminidase (Danio rerio) n=1 Tax=Cotesia congregata TaxID=51543 RepID=A0A8J2HA08_COTCN|nr:Similar to engase: Cytosolic endo-beta-N-acetylglucosaminidase (Danio rerio) [Cotesia congregata]
MDNNTARVARPFQTLEELYSSLEALETWPDICKLRDSADHYTVTIPPYGWIQTAHKHGVKILGTVITERTDGEKVWEKVLSSVEETKKFADALILLAKHFKFEGWLLNIENKIKPDDMEQLKYFIQYLTYGIHSEIDNAEIIWYDSVTSDGSLLWQNKLNEKNLDFFEICDGIFLNYNWTGPGLLESRSIAERTDRVTDIYVGLDVWGRGCPGGGGFNSIEAIKKIHEYDLSVAIFAPGWTHEYFNGQTFELLENIFWAQLTPYIYIHVPIYENEVFSTSFCHGYGEKFFYNGESLETSSAFYNLALQETQISVPNYQLRFTYVNIPEAKKKDKENKKDHELPVCIFETPFQVIQTQDLPIYHCPECPSKFEDRDLFNEHLEDHKQRPHICDICGASLKRKEHLDRHKQGHNKDRPYKCSLCCKAFKRNEHLARHQIIHSGNKNQICSKCGKAFFRKDHLKKHIQSHNSSKPVESQSISIESQERKETLDNIAMMVRQLRAPPFSIIRT